MGDVIFIDFRDKRKEFKWIDPKQIPEIVHLDKCLKETIQAMLRCTNDKYWLQAQLIIFEDILDKAIKDVPK